MAVRSATSDAGSSTLTAQGLEVRSGTGRGRRNGSERGAQAEFLTVFCTNGVGTLGRAAPRSAAPGPLLGRHEQWGARAGHRGMVMAAANLVGVVGRPFDGTHGRLYVQSDQSLRTGGRRSHSAHATAIMVISPTATADPRIDSITTVVTTAAIPRPNISRISFPKTA